MRRRLTTAAWMIACVSIGTACGSSSSASSPKQGSAGTTARAASATGLDREYLTTSIEGDRFEVAGGRLALRKSHNPAVLKLARTLVSDHSQSLAESIALARKLGAKVESSPSPSEQWELKTVATQSGATFDRWYSSLEVFDHMQDIQEATDEVEMGGSAQAIASARKEIPTLRHHLALSRAALRAS